MVCMFDINRRFKITQIEEKYQLVSFVSRNE